MSLPVLDYSQVLSTLKNKIREARLRSALKVNAELIQVYYEIGLAILEQQKSEGWGAKIIDQLSIDLRTEFPDIKGFSVRNLKYMRSFAEAYPNLQFVQQGVAQIEGTDYQDFRLVQQAVAQLPWGHHVVILNKTKTLEERLFYVQKCVENNWGRDVLALQIDNNLIKRIGSSLNNFSNALPAFDSDLAVATFKNPYLFDFLAMGEKMKERDLEQALISHLKKFMLELGKGFAYVGNQYNLNVEGDDFFLDLLFYNTHLHCYVIFELKLGEFKPEFAGKLNFYINTVDAQIKGKEDKPTIGVLLCKTPNETVVKYALQGIDSPMGVSEYQLAEALPKQLVGEMPTIEELEKEIEEGYEELKTPVDKKLDYLKQLLGDLKKGEVKIRKSKEVIHKVTAEVLVPFTQILDSKLAEIKTLFNSWRCDFQIDSGIFMITYGLEKHIIKLIINEDRDFQKLQLCYRFEGFIQGGLHAFDTYLDVDINFEQFKYIFSLYRQNTLKEFLYDAKPSQEELNEVAERYCEELLDRITQQVERIKTL